MQWIIFAALAAAAAGGLVNEFVFSGRLFPSSAVALAAGLLVIALAAAATILGGYRNKLGSAARDLTIWAAIVAVLAFGYWLFG